MKLKYLAGSILAIGLAGNAQAYQKIFEWNDPRNGNYPPECSASRTYGTGGGGPGYGYSYDEYTVNCPNHPTLKVGVEKSYSQGSWGWTCNRVTVNNSNYSTGWNSCENWRVYKK